MYYNTLFNNCKIINDFEKGFEIPPEGHELGFVSKPAIIIFPSPDETEKALKNSSKSLADAPENRTAILKITEGKFHQVKRMFGARGKPVTTLRRISFGPLELDEALPEGGWRELTEEEIALLLKAAGMEEDAGPGESPLTRDGE